MPFFIDRYCDYIAETSGNTIVIYCFRHLEELGVDRVRFVEAFWKKYPYGEGPTGLNFFRFGLEHNEVFNARLKRPAGHPTFIEYIQKCLAPVVEVSRHLVDIGRGGPGDKWS
ncbi:MAG TPA: hypothetical protein VGK59_03780 [Ohtaekwangia sp.]